MRHVGLELLRAAGRKRDRPGTMRLLEVEQVAPVGRHVAPRRFALEKGAYDRAPAHAFGPHCEQVVALARDADAEADRFDGACLAEHLGRRGQFRGGFESELARIAGAPQRLRREFTRQ